MNLAEKITRARLQLRLSQSGLAHSLMKSGLHMTRDMLANIENGRRSIKGHEIQIFSKVLFKPEAYFFDDGAPGVSQYIPVIGTATEGKFKFSWEAYPIDIIPISLCLNSGKKQAALRTKNGEHAVLAEVDIPTPGQLLLVRKGEWYYFERIKEVKGKDIIALVVGFFKKA